MLSSFFELIYFSAAERYTT